MKTSKIFGVEGLIFWDVRVKDVVLEAKEGPYRNPVEITIRFKVPKQLSILELQSGRDSTTDNKKELPPPKDPFR